MSPTNNAVSTFLSKQPQVQRPNPMPYSTSPLLQQSSYPHQAQQLFQPQPHYPTTVHHQASIATHHPPNQFTYRQGNGFSVPSTSSLGFSRYAGPSPTHDPLPLLEPLIGLVNALDHRGGFLGSVSDTVSNGTKK